MTTSQWKPGVIRYQFIVYYHKFHIDMAILLSPYGYISEPFQGQFMDLTFIRPSCTLLHIKSKSTIVACKKTLGMT